MTTYEQKFNDLAAAGFDPTRVATIKAAKEAADRAAHKAVVEEARKRAISARLPHLNSIRLEVIKMVTPRKAAVDPEQGRLTIDGVDVTGYLAFEAERRSKYFGESTGRLRCSVGTIGERKSYPERKDGTFNYASIAEDLVDIAVRKNMRERIAATEKANVPIVSALRQELGAPDYFSPIELRASDLTDRPVLVTLKWTARMTVEDARRVYAGLVDLGIVGKK
jgi:hypothetical protein